MAAIEIINDSSHSDYHDENDHHSSHDQTSSSFSLRDKRKKRPMIIIIAGTACTILTIMTISYYHTPPTYDNNKLSSTPHRSLSYDLTPPPLHPPSHPHYLPPILSSLSPQTSSSLSDRTPIIETLTAAGVTLTPEQISQLPTWSDITALYGPTPIIYGLERCPTFRAKNQGQPVILSPQGLFNTGTRHLRQLLESNCRSVGEVGNPFWWKHAPVFFAHKRETIYRKNDSRLNTMEARFEGNAIVNVLSVTSVKDPFYWMGSMCRKKYNVRFKGRPEGRCPVFDRVSRSKKKYGGGGGGKEKEEEEEEGVDFSSKNSGVDYTVYTDNGDFQMTYDNMSDLWNDFNKGHLVDASFPRLIIRYEDTLFHTKEVVTKICECAGGYITSNFNYKLETTKPKYGDPENMLVHAMIKYGSSNGRYEGMAEEDVKMAAESLDEELMGKFRYTLPPTTRGGRIREEDEDEMTSVNDAIDLGSGARTSMVVDNNYGG